MLFISLMFMHGWRKSRKKEKLNKIMSLLNVLNTNQILSKIRSFLPFAITKLCCKFESQFKIATHTYLNTRQTLISNLSTHVLSFIHVAFFVLVWFAPCEICFSPSRSFPSRRVMISFPNSDIGKLETDFVAKR